jgi:hypothetical protein
VKKKKKKGVKKCKGTWKEKEKRIGNKKKRRIRNVKT